MRDAAADHQVVTIRCNLCHRSMNYLASDLLTFVGPDWPVNHAPFACHKHGREYLNVRVWSPTSEHIGRIPVRRPAKVIQTWQTVMLGD